MEQRSSISNIMTTAGWTAALTTVATMGLATAEQRSPFEPVNAISHIMFGEEAIGVVTADPHFLVTGLALNFGAMVGWSAVAELGYQMFRLPAGAFLPACIVAILTTVLAYMTDFRVVPPRFTPGFERVLSKQALLWVYGTMGVALVLGGLLRARSRS